MHFESKINGDVFNVELNDQQTEAVVDDTTIPLEVIVQKSGRMLFRTGTKLYKIDNIEVNGHNISFTINGSYFEATVKDEQDLLLEKLGFHSGAAASAGSLNAPMPGKILELLITEGVSVEEAQPVLILEAMKMENELKSPTNGVVSKLHVQQGDNVEKNQLLIDIEPSG
ncbi:acetyl-CoA carboxylase biotin carboxyl carrier protein subunit [Rhodohalobacter sp. 614A]|uniref:acetyl-CoA carboxylase biotin carboxyl carrier protein subunit n=1 Tax=Rhodohalobacter sp. 614A TaxID=2908649 RepID=UPI001F304664|nr:acetyl-CoA carboxylase biotin carboxyl carrier protein subunit [Rhodohalobacter sp. 614A]